MAENYRETKERMKEMIKGRQGIDALGHRHIDLWNAGKWHYEGRYIDLRNHESTKLLGI